MAFREVQKTPGETGYSDFPRLLIKSHSINKQCLSLDPEQTIMTLRSNSGCNTQRLEGELGVEEERERRRVHGRHEVC